MQIDIDAMKEEWNALEITFNNTERQASNKIRIDLEVMKEEREILEVLVSDTKEKYEQKTNEFDQTNTKK